MMPVSLPFTGMHAMALFLDVDAVKSSNWRFVDLCLFAGLFVRLFGSSFKLRGRKRTGSWLGGWIGSLVVLSTRHVPFFCILVTLPGKLQLIFAYSVPVWGALVDLAILCSSV
jgi:hypothetical protein